MIPLSVRAEIVGIEKPFIVRLNSDWRPGFGAYDCHLKDQRPGKLTYATPYGELDVSDVPLEDLDGDVLLVVPGRRIARRLIRANSSHNTLLVTEQCDQLCVMCSQPPKKHHVDLFPYYDTAVLLAPEGAVIGISGGEPMLYKEQLLDHISKSLGLRPDLSYHVLTNGQHFEDADVMRLLKLPPGRVLWGIPLYSSSAALHDEIVKKDGAFHRLEESFSILYQTGSSIELRTVVTNSNAAELVDIASYISTNLPFIFRWAVMQLERIGYARQNWESLFYDNSTAFGPIADALDIALVREVPTQLYNFPLCTVPGHYRHLAPASISDWKRKYLSTCTGCSSMGLCGGFFEWYEDRSGFRNLVPL